MDKIINIAGIQMANHLPFVLIAGPCQIESLTHSIEMAGSISNICKKLSIPFIYKSSYDKANRTNINTKRGIGMEQGLQILAKVREKIGCPVLTDVHTEEQCKIAAEYVDVLQIPALLCRQTDLLVAAAKTKLPVNVKKGQFLAPWDIANIAEKIEVSGNKQMMFTERGTSFGYNTLVNDMRSLVIMAKTGYPVVFDATHSVQQPGGMGKSSGGQREFILPLAKAAVALGVAGIFMEVHQDPDNAPSDGPCMLKLQDLENTLEKMVAIDKVVK